MTLTNEIDYDDSKYPVRANFAEGHNRYWQRLAAPGNWLTGAQRVAVAKEIRQTPACTLCNRRKAALSPYQVDSAHDAVSDLSDTMVEVVHRITTDPGRVTKTWFDGIIQQGLKVEEYIEIIGTVVHLFSTDEFCRGLGLPLNELPAPLAGEPSQYRPAGLIEDGDGAWVPILPRAVDSGAESDLWEGTLHGYVIRALSLVPDEVRSLGDLAAIHYLAFSQIAQWEGSPQGTLSRIQTEVVAARVSAINGCFY